MHATEDILDRRGLEEPLEHAAGAAVLQALVRRQRVLRTVRTIAELANVERVRLLVFVLEVAFEGVVARKRTTAVRTFLRLVYATRRGWWHLVHDSGRRRRCRMHPVART